MKSVLRPLLPALLLAVSTALAACASGARATPGMGGTSSASGQPAAAAPAHQAPGPRYTGAVSERIDYGDGDLVLSPPGDRTPRLTWEQAVARCNTQTCITGAAPDVSLALATTLHSGKVGSGDKVIPGPDHALTYVLTATNQACDLPAGPVPGQPKPVERGGCTFIQLVDADSGKVGYAMSGNFTRAPVLRQEHAHR